MSTNISKKKRDDLLDKIKQIRAFIAAAPQDENTGNLLSYLSDLEKDVNGKKYGLVFEEHREEIDEVLDTHTPVLTEDADLFIDHGGQMNFLIEGDNLASLKLLEKTHKGKIDLIYIDPPYNTGASNWIYDNDYVDGNDLFKHSKWLSMMQSRLTLAKNLLTDKGVLICAIDENESANCSIVILHIAARFSQWSRERFMPLLSTMPIYYATPCVKRWQLNFSSLPSISVRYPRCRFIFHNPASSPMMVRQRHSWK